MNIILSGCLGRLGRAITALVSDMEDIQIAAGGDINENPSSPFPIFGSFGELPRSGDVIVDFSSPVITADLLAFAGANKIPVVLSTTGHSAEQLAMIEEAAKQIPIFASYNMSLGINLLCELAKTAARVLGGSFDIEVVEEHHNQKVDAPSGTAIMLANALSDGLDYEPEYTYNRHEVRRKRGRKEIGMHSIRGGTIIGEHEIIFAGHDEVVRFSHSIMSKDVFALGALDAARFIVKQGPGKYTMKDLIKS